MDIDAVLLTNKYGQWGEHPNHPVADWQYEVANGDTRQGYWGWVAAEISSDDNRSN